MEYKEILISFKKGTLTVRDISESEASHLNTLFTRYDGKEDCYGTRCHKNKLEERKKWLIKKALKNAQVEFDRAENKLNTLKRLLQ